MGWFSRRRRKENVRGILGNCLLVVKRSKQSRRSSSIAKQDGACQTAITHDNLFIYSPAGISVSNNFVVIVRGLFLA